MAGPLRGGGPLAQAMPLRRRPWWTSKIVQPAAEVQHLAHGGGLAAGLGAAAAPIYLSCNAPVRTLKGVLNEAAFFFFTASSFEKQAKLRCRGAKLGVVFAMGAEESSGAASV
eukprot:COSAG04_NODE_517_length_13186_cov_7.434248_3_plen_113_part_00